MAASATRVKSLRKGSTDAWSWPAGAATVMEAEAKGWFEEERLRGEMASEEQSTDRWTGEDMGAFMLGMLT